MADTIDSERVVILIVVRGLLCLMILLRVEHRLVDEVHPVHVVLHAVEILGQLHDALHPRSQLVASCAL